MSDRLAKSSWVPPWISAWTPATLRGDLIAGLTLAAYLLPAGLGDASLAGLPPEAGLYACLFSGLVFWLFCGSRHTAITVTSAISLLVGTSLGSLSGGDPGRYAALAAATAIITGSIAVIAWIVRAGVLVEFISETVLVGFKVGIALVLISTQIPKLLGIPGGHGGGFLEKCLDILRHVPETNPVSLVLGIIALAALIAGKRWLANRPVAVVVVITGIMAATLFDLPALGVKTLGEVPEGLPSLGIPAISPDDLNDLLPLALACFLLMAVESAAIGRMFAARHAYPFDANRELLALGVANLAAGLGRGFPVSGGMSQSLVNEAGGARTPVSGFIAALLILVVVLTWAGLLRDLPQPVLAAIVLVAVSGLIKVDVLRRLWRFDRGEIVIVVAVVTGILASGILRGVLIGVVVSILIMLRRAARPRVAELGRVPGTDVFADRQRHPENQIETGLLALRLEGPLLYFNVRHVHDQIQALIQDRPDTRLLVLNLGMTAQLDLAGCEMLEDLHRSLAARGIDLALAEVHGHFRDALRRSGCDTVSSSIEANQTTATLFERWCREHPRP